MRLSSSATIIAALTSPFVVAYLHVLGQPLWLAALVALLLVAAFRGAVDLALKHLVERPELTLESEPEDLAADALQRKRRYFWARKFRLLGILSTIITVIWLFRGGSWLGTWGLLFGVFGVLMDNPQMLVQMLILPLFFIANFGIMFGPLLAMNIVQIKGTEPGDADFGVKMGDVRGQAEAKEEIRKVITLWQSGEAFEKAGGKKERGVLFLGPPGVGKTFLAKGIATNFNCPIVMAPGTAFSNAFMGMEIVVVLWMARKARKLAAKWESCLIFIDEIDTIGMRRRALDAGGMIHPQIPGGMMGGMTGGMALNALLVKMDGIDAPPFMRKFLTNKINLWLDAMYVVPRSVGRVPLRLPRAKPISNNVFFVGATNVPLEALDPALTRPGRMGRHVYFRMPTKRDRIDIFNLYLDKVAHEAAMDTEHARDELARITSGYSPAMIEQVCSIALAYAIHSGRNEFSRADLLEAMVTIEAGTALGWGYESDEEERSTAIHEAGHAAMSYLYKDNFEATRLSIQKRGATGGHLSSAEMIERFAYHRGELMGDLVTTLGAYAAEYVFFGDNTQGVGGDLGQASHLAGLMVGRWGMAAPVAEGADTKKLLRIGQTLVAVGRQGDIPIGPSKLREEALILGVAFVRAWNACRANQAGIEKIVAALLRQKEISGDDLEKLLKSSGLEAPEIDWTSADSYPAL